MESKKDDDLTKQQKTMHQTKKILVWEGWFAFLAKECFCGGLFLLVAEGI